MTIYYRGNFWTYWLLSLTSILQLRARSECDILIKIIHERVVDSDPDVVEPSIVLPIAWQTSQQQDHVPYSSFRPNTCSASSNVHDCSQQLDNNIVENGWLEESQHVSPQLSEPCGIILYTKYVGTQDHRISWHVFTLHLIFAFSIPLDCAQFFMTTSDDVNCQSTPYFLRFYSCY